MPKLDEQTGAILLILGVVFFFAGYLWLLVRAFRTRIVWGVIAFFLPIVGGLAFILTHFRKCVGPLVLLGLGLIFGGSPYALNALFPPVLAPVENVTTGEKDLTLTGLANYDYATLKEKHHLTVLQMGNPDVTDTTLEFLKAMEHLKRLDLNDTQITDAGLQILASLPALEDLKLSRTKVTDEGIKKFLATAKALNAITVTGTSVKTATLRDWKNAQPDQRKYVK
jgi:hypothetical protein